MWPCITPAMLPISCYICFLSHSFCLFLSLQYVVIPECRSTGEAIQILFIHLLGDAASPFIVGAVSIICYCLRSHTAYGYHFNY